MESINFPRFSDLFWISLLESTKIPDTDVYEMLSSYFGVPREYIVINTGPSIVSQLGNYASYEYEQYIDTENLRLVLFDDDDYKEDTPTIGIRFFSSERVLNYTLDFKRYPNFTDLGGETIKIMGKSYNVTYVDLGLKKMVFSKLNKPRGDLISMRESNLCILMQPIKFSKEKLRKILENGGDPSSNLGGGV